MNSDPLDPKGNLPHRYSANRPSTSHPEPPRSSTPRANLARPVTPKSSSRKNVPHPPTPKSSARKYAPNPATPKPTPHESASSDSSSRVPTRRWICYSPSFSPCSSPISQESSPVNVILHPPTFSKASHPQPTVSSEKRPGDLSCEQPKSTSQFSVWRNLRGPSSSRASLPLPVFAPSPSTSRACYPSPLASREECPTSEQSYASEHSSVTINQEQQQQQQQTEKRRRTPLSETTWEDYSSVQADSQDGAWTVGSVECESQGSHLVAKKKGYLTQSAVRPAKPVRLPVRRRTRSH